MRVWDLPVRCLCPKHLRGEHLEIHVMWNVIKNNLKGWSRHPETMRWQGKLDALKSRHDSIIKEFARRRLKFNHQTPIEVSGDSSNWPDYWQEPEKQIKLLTERCIECKKLLRRGE